MHPLEYRFLKQLMDEQIETQAEIKARNSALYDGELSLDEALTQRTFIDHDEAFLDHLDTQLLELADQGFLGYAQPGGLTTLFYGYSATPPSAYAPGHYARERRQRTD